MVHRDEQYSEHPSDWHSECKSVDEGLSGEIKDAVTSVENIQVRDLMTLLGSVKRGQGALSSSKVARETAEDGSQ